ncbi:hypothetical protein T492DRAFT_834611 [Pavlovales sp. CCMP2436]|nr:hypothetical protein T492DRAFT_834611 [Pavlovales sp. CCMP2436]
MGLTSDELKRIGKMSHLRTRPAKSPQDENNQIARLMSNEIILQKIIQRYGNLDTKGGRDAIGIVFGVHNKTIDKLMAMRRTGGTLMSNVYGALESTGLDVTIDPCATVTSAVTQLSFSSLETPQNQTRDLTKILKKNYRLQLETRAAPLTYAAEASLPISLGQAVTKAVGVQWSFSSAKPISAGCICVLGDTKLLQDEATTDPKASTYTINQILPEEVVAETTYPVTDFRYIPGQTQQRTFTRSSLDTPTVVLAKWKATMSPAVAYAGFTQSFGHAALSFDSDSGKYSGSNASKINLGLNTSTTLNVFCNLNMPLRPFANVASSAYVRSGVVIDASDIEITRNPEGSSSISFYNQIYKPVIRICGGSIVSNTYTGIVCPIARLTVLSNESRALTLTDFLEKRLPTTIGHDSYFSGNIIGRANNGDPYNVIDNILKRGCESLSCAATADSWLITTDNQYNSIQVVATPAYNPTSITALNKASPVFLAATSITSSDDWQVVTGWRISASSIYQNNTSFNPNLAFDRNSTTYWASAEQAYSSTGVGSQNLTNRVSRERKNDVLQNRSGGKKRFSSTRGKQTKSNNSFMSVAHVPYKYWRITITLIKTSGVAIYTTISYISLISGWSVGMTSLLSAQPVTLSTFKLILGNSYGVVVSMLDTPIDWQFNLLLIKKGQLVKSGLYNLSLTTGCTKLS